MKHFGESKAIKSKYSFDRSWLLPAVIGVFVFAMLVFFKNDTLSIDEVNYMQYSRAVSDWNSIFNVEGKEPLPMWMAHLAQFFLGHTIEVARGVTALMGAASVMAWVVFSRVKALPLFLVILTIFGSAYFIFYSRTFLYEIYLVLSGSITLLGVVLWARGYKRGLLFTFVGVWVGTLSKSSYALFLVILPLVSVLELIETKQVRNFADLKLHRKNLFQLFGIAGSAYGVNLFYFFLLGQLRHYFEMRAYYSVPIKDILAHLFESQRYVIGATILWVDLGKGICLAIIALATFHFWSKRRIYALAHLILFLIAFTLNVQSTRILWARYLIPIFPLALYSVFSMLSVVPERAWRYSFFALLLSFQSISFWNTSLPLLNNSPHLTWTRDEIDQHINGIGAYRIMAIRDRIFELGRDHKIELTCQGPFAEAFCEYLDKYYPNLSNNSYPPLRLRYIKSNKLLVDPKDSSVIVFLNQEVTGHPESLGYLYLLRN